jgi:hypothetical protein
VQVSAQGAERMRPNLYEWIGDRFREYADLDPLATRQESLWLAFGKHIAASTGASSVGAMVDLPVMSFVKQLPVERFVTQLRVRTGWAQHLPRCRPVYGGMEPRSRARWEARWCERPPEPPDGDPELIHLRGSTLTLEDTAPGKLAAMWICDNGDISTFGGDTATSCAPSRSLGVEV